MVQQQRRHFFDEADIGSGEKTPGQCDIERDVASLNVSRSNRPQDEKNQAGADRQAELARPGEQVDVAHSTVQQRANGKNNRILQSGEHIARVMVVMQADGRYEAQLYVRMMCEPEVAEIYMPAGLYETEAEAWAAAENRAKHALNK